jgi:lia operon protein LiaG
MDIKKIVLWLVVIMVASLSIAAVVAVVSGYTPGNLMPESTAGRFATPVEEERAFPAGDIKEIQVKAISSDINIIAVEGSEIKAHLYGKTVSGVTGPVVELIAETRGSKLAIEVKHRPNISLFGNSSVTLDVFVPGSYNEDMRLETVSGDIAADNLNLNRLAAKSVSGAIEISSVDTAETSVKTTSGRVRLDGFEGNLDFDSVSGGLDVQYNTFDSDIRGKTVSGSLEIILPADAAFTLEAKTVSGDINCGFPVTVTGSLSKRGLSGTVSSGDNSIALETVSGNARIYSQ